MKGNDYINAMHNIRRKPTTSEIKLRKKKNNRLLFKTSFYQYDTIADFRKCETLFVR